MEWFKSPAFRLRAEQLMRLHNVPGFSIAVLQGDEVTALGFGHAVVDPPMAVTPDTVFDIASCSKSFTGVCVALLVEDDKYPEVKWDAAVSELLPDDFVLSEEALTKSVTVDDIVSHRSGMPRHDLSYMGPRAEQPDNARSVTRSLRHLPPCAPIRTKHLYNNMMFTVAAHLVAEKTQRPFSDFLEERIFGPLGMTLTSLQPSRARAKGLGSRMATGYVWDKEEKRYHAVQAPECEEGEGAGSIATTANDFIKWIRALVHREGPIDEAVYGELVRQRSPSNPSSKNLRPYTSPAVYGAGVDVEYYRGHAVVMHGGGITGYGSRFTFLPDAKFGVVVCGNAEGVWSVSGALTRELVDEFLQIPQADRAYRVPRRKPAKKKKNGEEEKKEEEEEEDDLHGPTDESDSDQSDAGGEGSKGELEQGLLRLEAYTGRFRHAGYHSMTVQMRSGQLYIDATDRSFPVTMEFEHVSGESRFKVQIKNEVGMKEDVVQAEFVVEGGRAVRMGLGLEPAMQGLIWFDWEDEGSGE